jgi:IS30 family transposase
MYHHITQDERVALATLLRAGYSQRKVAAELGINQSSISREIERTTREGNSYHAARARVLARERRAQSKTKYQKIENNPMLARRIASRLHPLVSPEVVAHDETVSHETIYAWIYRSRPDLKIKLPQRGKQRRRYGSKREKKQGWTQDVRSIHERSPGAEHRSRTGHFEGDTIRGPKSSLLTLTDRKSRFEEAVKIPNEGCDPVHEAILARKEKLSARSYTFDRGSAFSLWQRIECDTAAIVYFADPRAPWQRGTNENTNGRLRRVFPKGFDFDTITQRDLDRIVHLMNHTKRKCLNWRTPCEVFRGRCASD